MRALARTSIAAYGVAIVAVVTAVLIRWLLDPLMGDTLPLVTLFGAVAAAVWAGGYRLAMATAVVGYIACAYLFIEPRGQLGLQDTTNIVGLAAYLFTCSLIVAFGQALRVAQVRANDRGELLRVTLSSIGDAVITTDVDGHVTYLNAVAESLTGWTQREARGQPLTQVFRIVNEETRAPVESPATKALRDGVVVGLANHTMLIRKDGTERPIDDSAAPIRGEHGEVSGCVMIFRDVSTQRQTERDRVAQLHTARMLASIVENSDDAIISKSLDGVIRSWNAAAQRVFGYSAEEAVGRHVSLVIPRERIAEEDHIIASLRAGQRIDHFETERQRKDGQRILVSLTVSPIKDDTGSVVGASKIVRDITERRRTEADRERFVTLIETSTDFVGICDMNAVPLFVNRAGLAMVGLDSIDEARAKTVPDFFFPEDRHRVMHEFFPEVLENGHGEIEVRFRNFKTGEGRWMSYKVLVLRDTAGKPSALATVSQDVTERKRLEDNLRQLAAHLSEADRRKDEFLATLAHELRNPLAPLCNMLEVLKRAEGDHEMLRRARETMDRQLAQLVRLVDDLLDLNRITHNRLELRQSQVALSTVIHQAVEASRPLADAAGHELVVGLPKEPLYTYADPARLAQVFDNLLNNSCKYTDPGGKIWVTAERRGAEVVVSVKDTGSGIPPDKLESIFEMFTQVDRSPERSQGGLGIGLTLVKRLVQMHGGSIEVTSAGVGLGSEFVVRLPLLAGAVKSEPPKPEEQPLSQGRRILIVDDNSDAAVSLALLLKISGNETYTAHDGVEALEAFERDRPEVILLDIGLPKLSGHEVCRRIRERPGGGGVVIVALTGWGQESDRRKSKDAGFDGHLVKPVDYGALMDLLSSMESPASEVGTRAE
jgi:PAS domain S-box-containing protein